MAPKALDIDWRQIAELYRGGLSTTQIAERLGCSDTAVQENLCRVMSDYEKYRQCAPLSIDWQDVANWYREGLSTVQIAERLGCSNVTVSNNLRRVMSDYDEHKKRGGGRAGELSPSWKGGTSLKTSRGTRWKTIRANIRRAAGDRCRVCNAYHRGGALHVHHIRRWHEFLPSEQDLPANNPHSPNYRLNLVALCNSCHKKAEHDLEFLWPHLTKAEQRHYEHVSGQMALPLFAGSGL